MDNLENLKFEELIKICRDYKLPIYGKKSLLIQRINNFKSQKENFLNPSNSAESVSQSSSLNTASGFSLSEDL